MFVDFNRVFKGKPQTELKIPDAMVKHLSANLPKGVTYRATDDGMCEIISEGESVTIGGILFVPTETQRKVLGKKFTPDDVMKYSYNSQQPIPLQLKKEGYIVLNGEEFPIERMRYNPYCPVSIVSEKIFMYPHAFPEPFPLSFGSKKYTKQLIFHRVPNDSINIAAFESQEGQPLRAQYFVDESKQTISFNISFNLSCASTIRDIVESTSIYNAFADGEGLFCGKTLTTRIDTPIVKKYDSESLAFWEKVLLIESTLGIVFEPPQEDVDSSTINIVETLYQNLINGIPVRENKKIDSLDGEWEMVDNSNVQDSVGKSIYFEFQATSRVSLFGVNITLPCVIGIFDSILSDFSVKGKKYKLVLDHISEEKHMFTSTLRFKTEQELTEYMCGDRNQRISVLHDAKTAHSYLRTQNSN